MFNLTQLRIAARGIFDQTLQAVDSYDAIYRSVAISNSKLSIRDLEIDLTKYGRVYSIAFGKASLRMAIAIEEIFGDRLTAGVVSISERYLTARADEQKNRPEIRPLRHKLFHSGHPEPNEASLAAAVAAFELLERANTEEALVLFLVSGGGSAMFDLPRDGVTLADLSVTNKVLVNSPASIDEINTVRSAVSAIKGGQLAARAPNCDQVTLIVSDVPAGQEQYVASGPTLLPHDQIITAGEIVDRYRLSGALPGAVLRAIESTRSGNIHSISSTRLRKHLVLLDNNNAREAAANAARAQGFYAKRADEISDQPIDAGCNDLMHHFLDSCSQAPPETATCLVSGGEFSCPVRGEGIGGRNLETALRLAINWEVTNRNASAANYFVALCAGTDGVDGNSPAAGAIADSTTSARAKAIGLDAKEFLGRSDSYSFFAALGDVIATGPTGTNVRDLRIMLGGATE